jgi:hypothetical protein
MTINCLWAIQLIFFLALLSCSVKRQSIVEEKLQCKDCKTYESYIRDNWKIDSAGLFYFKDIPKCEGVSYLRSGADYTSLMGETCLLGVDIDSIKSLFGTPSMEFPHKLDYHLDARCRGKTRGHRTIIAGCARMQVYFDIKTRKVIAVGGIVRE